MYSFCKRPRSMCLFYFLSFILSNNRDISEDWGRLFDLTFIKRRTVYCVVRKPHYSCKDNLYSPSKDPFYDYDSDREIPEGKTQEGGCEWTLCVRLTSMLQSKTMNSEMKVVTPQIYSCETLSSGKVYGWNLYFWIRGYQDLTHNRPGPSPFGTLSFPTMVYPCRGTVVVSQSQFLTFLGLLHYFMVVTRKTH